MNAMLATLALWLTFVTPPAQLRHLYLEQLKDNALRDAATIVRASESLTTLFEAWSGSRLSREEFDRLSGQRLDLIKKSSRRLSENPLVERVDRVKKPVAARSEKPSGDPVALATEEIPPTLSASAEKARLVKKQLEQLGSRDSDGVSGRGRPAPAGPTVTVEELQAPRIRDLCKEMTTATDRVTQSLRTLGSRP